MARARIRRCRFIDPAVIGVAIHRAAARVEDLLEFGQAWQQRLQANQAVNEGAPIAIRIDLTIPFWPQAEHSDAASLKCGHQLVGVSGIAEERAVGKLLQRAEPFLPGRGQSQGAVLPSRLQVLRQCCAQISASDDRQCHGLASRSNDPRELMGSLLLGDW